MGNGSCCRKKQDRVDTLYLEDETPKDSQHNSMFGAQAQMVSLSDDSSDQDRPKNNNFKLGRFGSKPKSSQLSTAQMHSITSLPSEQQFSNFVTFQAIPSSNSIKPNNFSKLQMEWKQEMNELAHFNQKQVKKVQFVN
ncbi:hypothetical protein pb186bvf_001351 [Paramecium bursaria]